MLVSGRVSHPIRIQGNSDQVQDELRDVKIICACDRTFAALRGEGIVVTWGALEK